VTYCQANCISLSRPDNAAMGTIDSPDLDTVGGRVAFLRELKGWSGAELARQAGCSQPSVWELEKNKTGEVSARLLWAVAAALETTPEYLWSGELDPQEATLLAAFRKLPADERPPVLRAVGVIPPPAPPPQTNERGRISKH
jgi:transcriptional regulator with XRE-family HTH domain